MILSVLLAEKVSPLFGFLIVMLYAAVILLVYIPIYYLFKRLTINTGNRIILFFAWVLRLSLTVVILFLILYAYQKLTGKAFM